MELYTMMENNTDLISNVFVKKSLNIYVKHFLWSDKDKSVLICCSNLNFINFKTM